MVVKTTWFHCDRRTMTLRRPEICAGRGGIIVTVGLFREPFFLRCRQGCAKYKWKKEEIWNTYPIVNKNDAPVENLDDH